MRKEELICIGCPMGCMLTATADGDEITVTGNTCIKGEQYAKKELTNPTRIVTSFVKVENGEYPVVSVKTASDIPKEKIGACMEHIKSICLKAPVAIGEVVLSDVAGTGTDVIATKSVAKK